MASSPAAEVEGRQRRVSLLAAPVADTYWRSLFYFNLYRLIIALVLLLGTLPALQSFDIPFASGAARRPFQWITSAYLLACITSLVLLWRLRRGFNFHLSLQVVVDIFVFCTLIYLVGGLRSGIGIMLLVTLAGAGLVGQGRLSLFFAALATIGLLLQEVFHSLATDFEAANFFLAGILCMGFFGTAGSARLLARRVVANEELAKRRGIALRRQTEVSEQVIALMQDGVLVVAGSGSIQQSNPRALELLGDTSHAPDSLQSVSPLLENAFNHWLVDDTEAQCDFRVRGSGRSLQARFVKVDGEGDDTLVFLDDVGRLREESQKLKLAALGRLTANIAHEIRNPLSAIRHATELLAETRQSEEDDRLIRIMSDNTRRLDSIVTDVLQLGRRDRAHRELINLPEFVNSFIEQFIHSSGADRSLVRIAIPQDATLYFDRSHLHQILWNVASNALRHSRRMDGSIRIWCEQEAGWCALHLADDGDGIGSDQRTQVFEPFYTTHAKGTGLGLFIARELAEANGARFELADNAPGAHFTITGEDRA